MKPQEFRKLVREGKYTSQTSGKCSGYVQANVVILPGKHGKDFEKFCKLNSAACPVLEILKDGDFKPTKTCNTDADIRTDVPKYRIFKKGKLEKEVTDIKKYWKDDFYTFLIGCSFSFERSLIESGIPIRNIDEKKNVTMFKTKLDCNPVGIFKCKMVVTMRPVKKEMVEKAIEVTKRFKHTHGGPIYCGNDYYEKLGIKDIQKPDFGEPVTINPNEICCFWACGVTSSLASGMSEFSITHAPGHMFICDDKDN